MMKNKHDSGIATELTVELVANWIKNEKCTYEEVKRRLELIHPIILGMLPNRTMMPVTSTYTDDHIVCLDCGKKVQMLKRHLKATHNITFAEYKEKWDLPHSYPIVTKNYSEERSRIRKQSHINSLDGQFNQTK